jgi:FdhD protein
MKKNTDRIRKYYQYQNNGFHVFESEVIEEVPVQLVVNGEEWLTFMCTPLRLEELAAGFLYNEGIVNSTQEIESVRLCPSGDILDVWLNKSVPKPANWSRTSGCTGGTTTTNHDKSIHKSDALDFNGPLIYPETVTNLVNILFESQEIYQSAGGVHTSALCNLSEICVSMEDIGRHNTLDKIAGYCLIQNIKLDNPIIVTTGRVSSEMLQKSNRLSASMVVSRTSPTTLSIRMAESLGITLIGYARRNHFKLYTHPQRVVRK